VGPAPGLRAAGCALGGGHCSRGMVSFECASNTYTQGGCHVCAMACIHEPHSVTTVMGL
jgi:hypothetical protein